jgi:hypothetical protein
MDEYDFDESRAAASVDKVGEMHRLRPVVGDDSPLDALPRGGTSHAPRSVTRPEKLPSHPGVVWVRASDLLSTGTGRMAGRGIDFEADLARRIRRTPATTGRAIRDRAGGLPPLSEFGQLSEHPPFSRNGLGRP